MKIVPMTTDHLDQLVALEALCFTTGWTRVTLKAILEDPRSLFLVLLEDDTVVAFGGYHWILEEGNIDNVAVHPSFRGQGYGRLIVEELMAQAQRQGLTRMTLEVRESNKTAIRLYEEFGFEVVGSRRDYYTKPTEDALLMDWGTPAV